MHTFFTYADRDHLELYFELGWMLSAYVYERSSGVECYLLFWPCSCPPIVPLLFQRKA